MLDQYKIGNINIDSFKDFDVNRENIKFVENSIKLNDKCMKCKYLNLCRGGCKRYRDESKIHIYCKSYIKFFEYSLAKFNKL